MHSGPGPNPSPKWLDTQPAIRICVTSGLHGFRNESGEPASILILFALGGPREAYFEGQVTLSELTDDEQTDFMAYHDNHWVDVE